MTEQQIKWAKSHDWFVAAGTDGELWVREAWSDAECNHHSELKRWTGTFGELREWAGY